MNQKSLMKLSKWVLIVAGLVAAYEGLVGVNLVSSVLGSSAKIVDVLFGVAAVYLAYAILTTKKK